MYSVLRDNGKVVAIIKELGGGKTQSITLVATSREYRAFLAWNAQQNPPLDLSDQSGPTPDDLAAVARAGAKAVFSSLDALERAVRSVVELTRGEINLLRARLRAQDAAIAAATSLADLKTRWAALNAVPDRTPTQVRNAVDAAIDAL